MEVKTYYSMLLTYGDIGILLWANILGPVVGNIRPEEASVYRHNRVYCLSNTSCCRH